MGLFAKQVYRGCFLQASCNFLRLLSVSTNRVLRIYTIRQHPFFRFWRVFSRNTARKYFPAVWGMPAVFGSVKTPPLQKHLLLYRTALLLRENFIALPVPTVSCSTGTRCGPGRYSNRFNCWSTKGLHALMASNASAIWYWLLKPDGAATSCRFRWPNRASSCSCMAGCNRNSRRCRALCRATFFKQYKAGKYAFCMGLISPNKPCRSTLQNESLRAKAFTLISG